MEAGAELRVTGDPATLTAIFQGLKGDRARSVKEVSTYYDTADGRIWRRGYALRVWQSAGGRVLALERQDGAAGPARVWTCRIVGPVVDIGLLPPGAPRSEIGAILPEELRPRFKSETKRTRKTLKLDEGAIEVALEIGHIAASARRAELAELQFRMSDGPTAVLLEHVKPLLGQRRVTVCARSEVARGMELADDRPPASLKAAKLALRASDTIDQAVRKIVAITTQQIVGNLAAAADGRDPEGVHQLRVALRRLKSAMTLFKDQLADHAGPLGESTRHALKGLGPARDLDVFLAETLPPVMDGSGDNADLMQLAKSAETRRREAYTGVRRLVRAPQFNRFLLDLMIVSEEGGLVARGRNAPLRPTAAALLAKRHKKVLKAGRNFAHLPNAQRHEVRIALKKLRYACDYFQALFPKKAARPYLKRLASLQEDLGRLNDATVAEHLVDELVADDAEAAIGGAMIKGWYWHRLQTVESHMLEAWQDFAEAKPFWRT